jgi:ankyrin repeat protein
MSKASAILLAGILAGAIVPAQAQDHQATLWDASISGDTLAIARALDAGARIDSLDTRRNPNGRRALNWAAFNNRGPAVRLLVARGAGLNLTNNTGFTAVHHAAEGDAAEVLAILIDAGADISIPNRQGLLPLDTARGRGYVQIVRLLEAAAARKP